VNGNKKENMNRLATVMLSVFIILSSAYADTITLRSGEVVQGQIISETASSFEILTTLPNQTDHKV
jgi:hypothetical protein